MLDLEDLIDDGEAGMIAGVRTDATISAMRGHLARQLLQWEGDDSLLEPDQLRRRAEVLDRLDAELSETVLRGGESALLDAGLGRRAGKFRARLEAVNARLYRSIREDIQTGVCPEVFADFVHCSLNEEACGIGYDYLDDLVSGVLGFGEPKDEPVYAETERVAYQPTPARHIFRLITAGVISADDVVMDIGSGLGHVPLIVSICTGARSVGVELEVGYVESARECSQRLNLGRVSFFQEDARNADYSMGTVFYLFTPFRGRMWREVMEVLRRQTAGRQVRVCTFGPCTPLLAEEDWLEAAAGTTSGTDRVAVFWSRDSCGLFKD